MMARFSIDTVFTVILLGYEFRINICGLSYHIYLYSKVCLLGACLLGTSGYKELIFIPQSLLRN